MIFVATGTHHQPFDRLVRAADAAAAAFGESLIVQCGPSAVPVRGTRKAVLDPTEFERYLRDARIVVLHGGSSSFLQARGLGRRPIVVPRRPEHGEHVDDHQLRFVRTLELAEAVVVEPEGLVEAMRTHAEPPRPLEDRSAAFCARFGPLVDGLVPGRRA